MNLKTERLLLRPISLSDASFILELVNTKGWLEFIGDRNVLTVEDAENYIHNIINSSNSYYHVFELKESSKAIGVITLLQREDEIYPDIGFALLPEFEGYGYTVEAGKAYLQEVTKSDEYENIIAIALSTNKRSIRVIEKLGLKHAFDQGKENGIVSYFSLKDGDSVGNNNGHHTATSE